MNYKIYLYFILFLTTLSCASSKQSSETSSTVLSQYQFSELDGLMENEQRPVAVFLHAPWCKYCKNMEQTTLQNEAVKKMLNEKYYLISFDGEQKENVFFQQRNFKYQPTGRNTGTHELAKALGTIDGVLTYPAFVLLNSKYEIVFQHNAFLNNKEMEKILIAGVR